MSLDWGFVVIIWLKIHERVNEVHRLKIRELGCLLVGILRMLILRMLGKMHNSHLFAWAARAEEIATVAALPRNDNWEVSE